MSAAALICAQQEREGRWREEKGDVGGGGGFCNIVILDRFFCFKVLRDFLFSFLNLVTRPFMTQFKWKPQNWKKKNPSPAGWDDAFVTQKSMKYESVQAWKKYSLRLNSSGARCSSASLPPEPTPERTPSDLADELLVDFEPSITADIFPSVLCRVCVFQQPFSRPPVVNWL